MPKIWDRECDTCGSRDEAWDDEGLEAPCARGACHGVMRRSLGGRPSGFSTRPAGGQSEYEVVGFLLRKKIGGDA